MALIDQAVKLAAEAEEPLNSNFKKTFLRTSRKRGTSREASSSIF